MHGRDKAAQLPPWVHSHAVVPRVFVGGLAPSVTREHLAQTYAAFGDVEDARLAVDAKGRPRGFGYVIFRDEAAAARACRGPAAPGWRNWRLVAASEAPYAEPWADTQYELARGTKAVRDEGTSQVNATLRTASPLNLTLTAAAQTSLSGR